ncbi:hypothetical protein MKX03_010135 [Papaver bracteatum]|nr:hypothetical protein MKX03_010135 [Papaver bracteatum]
MGNIACHKSEASGRFPTTRGKPRDPVNFRPPNPAIDEKKDRGKVYVVILPAFQRCLYGGTYAADHLEVHHDLQERPARPGKANRLGFRGSIVPAASRT